MARLIKHREIIDDGFLTLADADPIPDGADVIVSLQRFQAEREALLARPSGRLGVRLQADQLAESIGADATRFAVIALEFPVFRDGRAYTTARLLRERFGYKGELRAVGDVLRDQLFYMARCGFDAFELKAGKDIHGALEAFNDFSVKYQPAADEALPLYRRLQR